MAESSIWWLLTGAAIVVELITGTFYLLMLAVGFAAAALAAHLGANLTMQLVTAAFIGGGAVIAWHQLRGKKMRGLPAQSNQDVNMDIGQTVQVDGWNPDGTASVKYRGAVWTAELLHGSHQAFGTYRVVQVVGSRLVVKKV
ncbi:MAG: NfeD family protein [Burkholderiaceae bacterium]|nr:NfeD family protein [Burkholderiaceae bacterium]